MNKAIKTVAILLAGLTVAAGTAQAAPRHCGHRPPPPPRHHVVVRHVEHHDCGAGWVALGAAVLGGLVGAALAR